VFSKSSCRVKKAVRKRIKLKPLKDDFLNCLIIRRELLKRKFRLKSCKNLNRTAMLNRNNLEQNGHIVLTEKLETKCS